MAAITLQTLTWPTLQNTTFQAATASDTVSGVTSDERCFIRAKNTNAATATVTINPVSPTSVKVPGAGPVALPAFTGTVPANTGDSLIGPIPAAYIDATGTVTLLNTGTITNLTLAVVRIAPASY